METGLLPDLHKQNSRARYMEGLMPGEGQRFVSKHSTLASERLILLFWNLQKGKKRPNIQRDGKNIFNPYKSQMTDMTQKPE